jgi:hypothetical protein
MAARILCERIAEAATGSVGTTDPKLPAPAPPPAAMILLHLLDLVPLMLLLLPGRSLAQQSWAGCARPAGDPPGSGDACGAHGSCQIGFFKNYCKCSPGYSPGGDGGSGNPLIGFSNYYSCCSVDCGDHGECVGPDTTTSSGSADGKCQCSDGYKLGADGSCNVAPGADNPCAKADCGIRTQNTVPGSGSDTTGKCQEHPAGEWGHPTAFAVCTCRVGWGPAGTYSGTPLCHRQICTEKSCNEHGDCIANQIDATFTCSCSSGWSGEHCETAPVVPDRCQQLQDCGDHGVCEDGDCTCKSGYRGRYCDVLPPDLCHNVKCNGNGGCNAQTGQCVCKTGYSGDGCLSQICGKECGNQGTCKRDEHGQSICQCLNGYTGSSCDSPPPSDNECASSPCGTHGDCMIMQQNQEYECICAEGWSGVNCNEDRWCAPNTVTFSCVTVPAAHA